MEVACAERAQRLAYEPAVDGLRGLAVAAVIAFHLGMPWATGGFLGVSVFFTLSGYLISRLLLAEAAVAGRLDLRRFWGRRLRRLLPASTATLLGVLALVALTDPAALGAARTDVLAALAQVANWRFLLGHQSYGDLFTEPSPVLHFWSLAIEEQFYLAYPILLASGLRVARTASRRGTPAVRVVFGAVLVAMAVAGIATTAAWAGDADVTYYATPARLTELAAGGLLAVVTQRRVDVGRHRRIDPVATVLGLAGLGATAVLVAATSVDDELYSRGGLPAMSLVSLCLLWGALRPGPFRIVLSFRPLVAVGAVSYGLYLVHWPVIQLLEPVDGSFGLTAQRAAWVALSGGVAAVSYHLLEQPIRRSRVLTGRWSARLAAVVALAAVAGAGVAVAPLEDEPAYDFAAVQAGLSAGAGDGGRRPAPEPGAAGRNGPGLRAPVPAPPRPVRVSVFGDSTALMVAWGLLDWEKRNPERIRYAGGVVEVGCGVGREGTRRYVEPGFAPVPEACRKWPQRWPAELRAHPADVAVVLIGPWDVTDRTIPGVEGVVAVGDPRYDEYLRREIVAAADALTSAGAEVAWLTTPYLVPQTDLDGRPIDRPLPETEPARIDRFNELLREVAAGDPDMTVVDLAGWTVAQPDGAPGGRLRPDGVHFTNGTSGEVAGRFLAEAILGVALRSGP